MSTVKVDTLVASDGSSPVTLTKQSAAKAWCKFGSDAQPDDSFNISSGTDVATGQWRFAKTNSMDNTNYTVVGTNGNLIASFTTGHNTNAIESTANHTQSKFSSAFEDFATDGYGMHNVHGDLA